MRITPYVVTIIVLDIVLTNIDRFWANSTAEKQFFVYDIATFGRIGCLAISQGLMMLFIDKIKIKSIDTAMWGLYWAYALYAFKLWLDIQSSFVNG